MGAIIGLSVQGTSWRLMEIRRPWGRALCMLVMGECHEVDGKGEQRGLAGIRKRTKRFTWKSLIKAG